MIESSMFTCPEIAHEEGLVSCDRMRRALQLLRTAGHGSPAQEYVNPLQALLDCHEASLWSAVDFHGIQHLDDHYISCCRTEALLEGALEEIELPREEDTALLRSLLREAAEAARLGGRPCRVSRPGEYLGLLRETEWEDVVNGMNVEEEDSSP